MHRLSDIGVLVTRPKHQADKLIAAIEAAGGHAILFPVIDIIGRPADDIRHAEKQLPRADIVLFISSNAVAYGFEHIAAPRAQYGAVGPATRLAIESRGRRVEIFPQSGFDSERLLAAAGLQDVSGRVIRIVRGGQGRELLGKTLQQRGARVDYLDVYRREPHQFSARELARLSARWSHGEIHCVVAMSVESLEFFLAALPPACREKLTDVSLVTPSKRVIQTALEMAPGLDSLLAAGPGTEDMLEALIDSQRRGAGAAS